MFSSVCSSLCSHDVHDEHEEDADDYEDCADDMMRMMVVLVMVMMRKWTWSTRSKMMMLRMMLRRKTDPKTGKHTLCELVQAKRTWTCHKRNFA